MGHIMAVMAHGSWLETSVKWAAPPALCGDSHRGQVGIINRQQALKLLTNFHHGEMKKLVSSVCLAVVSMQKMIYERLSSGRLRFDK